MTGLLEFRDLLKNLYSRFSLYILAAVKFLTMFFVTLLINQNIGYMNSLKSPVVAIVLSAVCAFLPANVIGVFATGLILLHLYSVSLPLTLIMFVIFLIIGLVYYRFSPKYAYALLITPVAFALKMPFLVPLILGLVATPITMVPVCLGSVVFFLLQNISASSSTLLRVNDESATQAYLFVIENTMKSSHMYLTIITVMITILIVYVIRRMSIDHAWTISIVTGVLFDVLVFLIGDFLLDISANVPALLIGAFVSFLLVFALQFFVFSVDYSRTEYVQFEDDEYYYYVKAVPKISIAKREKEVKRINPQRKIREDRHRVDAISRVNVKKSGDSKESNNNTDDNVIDI